MEINELTPGADVAGIGCDDVLAAQLRRQIFQDNLVAFRHNDGAFDGVAQLSEIARPGVSADTGDSFVGKSIETPATQGCKMLEDSARQNEASPRVGRARAAFPP